MSESNSNGSNGDHHDGFDKDKALAKTAGFVVFSGIAISILKALNPYKQNNNTFQESPPIEKSPAIVESKFTHFEEPVTRKPQIVRNDSSPPPQPSSFSGKTVEIVKGDTLWALSRKHGVSVDALKEANGLEGDKIYAGKKLVIP
ncbi:uncharacterized protein LOC113361311 [Papaver somniferum]|uniref:uncharacterized protein LOC113361311 n=1 Tax=Papaver somniferum TaxID=3469 RepID=UPI000E70389A|nr:uncharacterized protein LOC113361311 [Papaver somniferum]